MSLRSFFAPVLSATAQVLAGARVATFAVLCATPLVLPFMGAELDAQETHLLIVSGLGGDPAYEESFVSWGTTMALAAEAAGLPTENIHFLAEDPSVAPQFIDGRSTQEEVEAAILAIDERADPEDRVLVVLIGHGSGEGPDSRVSIPGRSIRASEYNLLLETLAPRNVALVNLASASGDFITELAGEHRVLVTATRSSRQRNAAIFGGFFVQAFAEDGADADRDGRISILEAYEFGRLETERYYEDRGLLASEQSLIEDRLTGQGSEEPNEDPEVGILAARFYLAGAVPTTIAVDGPNAERLTALYQEQERLDQELAVLQQRETQMEPEAFQTAQQELLIEIARIGSEIRSLEATP